MAVTNRYKGDARTGFTTSSLGPTETRLRTANDASAMGDKTFEMNAGSSISFFYKRVSISTGGASPNKVTIAVKYGNGATVVRTFLSAGAEPADGASFTFFATSDGTSGGSPRAGVYRLYLQTVCDNSSSGLLNYSVDSDGVFGAFGASYIGAVGTADSGCLRGNCLVTAMTAPAYSGSRTKFVYPDQPTWTVTHTQRFGSSDNENVRLDVIDSSDVQFIAGSAGLIDAGTSFTQTQNINTDFTAADTTYGLRLLPTGNSAFVPNSGAILWAKMVASGVTQDGNNVKRSSFFVANPTITLWKNAGLSQSGVASFRETGRTNAQDVFKRTGSVNATNAAPFLRVFVADAAGVGINTKSMIVAVRTPTAAPESDTLDNTQTISTDATGKIDWTYTIGATAPAFNRFLKGGTARVAGSHLTTGPDDATNPPASFSAGGSGALYTGPFPCYARDVKATGNAFAGVKEPTVRATSVFGVNAEILFEDCWTGSLADSAEDANGCPNGPGKREQTLGAGSLKAKLTTLINEGTIKVITPSEFNPKDVAGCSIDLAGAEVLAGRRALHDVTNGVVSDAGTNLSNSFNLDTPLGYATGTSSYDSIAAPSDPGALSYYQAYKDSNNGNEATEDATGFLISGTGSVPAAGFQTDTGNNGYFAQSVSFVAADLSIALLLDIDRTQTGPGVARHFVMKVIRIAPDDTVAAAIPDSAPVYMVAGQPTSGPLVIITQGLASAVAGGDGSDFEFTITTPSGYDSVKVMAFAKVNGSRTPGGGESQVQIGWDFDAVDFAAGIPFR